MIPCLLLNFTVHFLREGIIQNGDAGHHKTNCLPVYLALEVIGQNHILLHKVGIPHLNVLPILHMFHFLPILQNDTFCFECNTDKCSNGYERTLIISIRERNKKLMMTTTIEHGSSRWQDPGAVTNQSFAAKEHSNDKWL